MRPVDRDARIGIVERKIRHRFGIPLDESLKLATEIIDALDGRPRTRQFIAKTLDEEDLLTREEILRID